MFYSFFTSCILSCYFTSLVSFSFVSHPITYCILLIFNALSVSCYLFMIFGFSWYLVLFCLVYVGGVYVLFIFISVHGPNTSSRIGINLKWVITLFLFFLLVLSFLVIPGNAWSDNSWYLCSYFEGFTYCFLSLVVLFGFMVASFIMSRKDSFFR